MPWYLRAVAAARAQGAMPYLVEGFAEVSEAVRRGHAVMLLRQQCEVADGVRVFTGDGIDDARPGSTPVVTVVRFDPGSARYVLNDARSLVGQLELTPRRLQRYLDDPARMHGVALGAA